jgi:hypothetical protein
MSGAGHVIDDVIDSHLNGAQPPLQRSRACLMWMPKLGCKKQRRPELTVTHRVGHESAATAVGRQKKSNSKIGYRSDGEGRPIAVNLAAVL